MKILLKKNFHEVSSFNCKITKFFGYFHFTLKSDDEKLKECKPTVYLKFVIFTVLGFLASIKSSKVNIGNSTNSVILQMGIRLLIQQTLFMPTVFRVLNFVVRHQHEKIIDNIQSIDDDLTRMGANINYRKHFLVAIIITTSYYGFLLLTFYIDDRLSSRFLEISEMDLLGVLLAAFNIAAYLSYEICHMLVIYATYKRFQFMNQILKWHNLDRELMKRVGKIHSKLSKTLHLINSCFALNLLNYFLQFIIFSIFFFFGLYHYLASATKSIEEFVFIIIAGFYLLFYFFFSAWIITVSSWVQAEGSQAKILVHSKSVKRAKDLKALNNFCVQLDHNEPVVTCGLFNVDWTLLFAFISAVFSYLIILIQFESG
jgi:hypothetical protein